MKYIVDNIEEIATETKANDRSPVKWQRVKNTKSEGLKNCKRQSKGGNQVGSKRRRDPKDKVEQLCRVCAEQAAGYHYGVFTCEGCKSFFGRYQKGKRKPPQECMNGHGNCDVRSRARNRCRYCRYQKCLSAGMSKSASRYGRRSNWFKVHCLSEAREDFKTVHLATVNSAKNIQPTANSEMKSLDTADRSPSSPKLSVIVPPIVVNPKPAYPEPNSPPGFLSTLTVFHSNPLPNVSMEGNHPSSFSNVFFPNPSLVPTQQRVSLPSTSTTSAFSPVLGYYSFPPVVNMGTHHPLFIEQSSPTFLSAAAFQSFPSVIQPIQEEPLDLSIKSPMFVRKT